jgi:hypothetical protein
MTASRQDIAQGDLFSGISDLDAVQLLLADIHDDLAGKVLRFRHLTDLCGALGTQGTMLFGGSVTFSAWTEARSSFVHGNYLATVLLCQSLIENLLAAFLHGGLMMDDLPPRVTFMETLNRCRERKLITEQDADDLERLMSLRNPLTHFRTLGDAQNLDCRAMTDGLPSEALIQRDAWFAIDLAVRMLAKPGFRLGPSN